MNPKKGPNEGHGSENHDPGWEAFQKADADIIEELYPATKEKLPAQKRYEGGPTTIKARAEEVVDKTKAKLETFKQDLFTRNWRKAEIETSSTQFGIEERHLTGNYVKFRDLTDGHVLGMISRKDGPVRIASDPDHIGSPYRINVGGEVFIKVYDKNNRPGFIAEQFLMTHEEKIARIAKAPEGERKLEGGEAKLREVVLYRLKGLPTAMQNAMYKKWDNQYQQLRKKGMPENAFYAEANKIYQSVFGREYNIFADRARMEIALAIESTKIIHAGKEKSPEKKLNAALAQLGWEIGAYFAGDFDKVNAWSAKEIRDAFGLKSLPENWGGPDSTVTFNYKLGALIFQSPANMVYFKKAPVKPELIAKAMTRGQKINEQWVAMRGDTLEEAEKKTVGYRAPGRGTRSEATAVPEYAKLSDELPEIEYTVKGNESPIDIVRKFYGRGLDDSDLAEALFGGKEALMGAHDGQKIKLPKILLGRPRAKLMDLPVIEFEHGKTTPAPQEDEPEEPPDLSEENPYL